MLSYSYVCLLHNTIYHVLFSCPVVLYCLKIITMFQRLWHTQHVYDGLTVLSCRLHFSMARTFCLAAILEKSKVTL